MMKKIIAFGMLLIGFFQAHSSDYYWVNHSGSWSDFANHWAVSSGGSVYHVQPPTPFDNVYIDANSLSNGDSITLDTTIINCKNLNMTGADHPVLLGASYLIIYGSLLVPDPVTWNLSGTIVLQSSSSGNSINLSGIISMPSLSLTLQGHGMWDLQSDINLPLIHLGLIDSAGLVLNDHTIHCNEVDLRAGAILDMTASTVTCGEWRCWDGATVDADSASITATDFDRTGIHVHYHRVTANHIEEGDSLEFDHLETWVINNLSHSVFHDVVFTDAARIDDYNFPNSSENHFDYVNVTGNSLSISSNTDIFDTLIFSLPGSTFSFGGTLNITTLFQLNGSCSGLATINNSAPSILNIPGGTFNLDYVLLHNVSFTGGASFTATNSVDNGGVSGIALNSQSPRNLYWVGGTGFWNDISHWATVSGGTAGSCVPSQIDNVFFDSHSFVSGDSLLFPQSGAMNCKSLNATGADHPVFYGSLPYLSIYGSLIVPDPVTWYLAGSTVLKSSSSGNVINLAGVTLTPSSSLTLQGHGMWDLQSDINLPLMHLGLIDSAGLVLNDHTIHCNEVDLRAGAILDMTASTVTCGEWRCWDGAMVDADSASIIATDFDRTGIHVHYHRVTANHIEEGDSLEFDHLETWVINNLSHSVFHDVVFTDAARIDDYNFPNSSENHFDYVNATGNSLSISSNTDIFDTLIFSLPGSTFSFGGTLNITTLFQLNGSCSGLATINNSAPSILNIPGGTFNLDYVLLHNVSFAGGASFTATNSVDNGGVSGIALNSQSPGNLYWVGGTGFWNDISHWATVSGGAGGNCIPSQIDNVFFDSHSFVSGDSLLFPQSGAMNCKSLNATGADHPVFYGSLPYLIIYGSLIVPDPVTWYLAGSTVLKSSSSGNVINLAGVTLTPSSSLTLQGHGMWDLQSDINLPLMHLGLIDSAGLVLNDHTIHCNEVDLRAGAILDMTASTVTCGEWRCWDGAMVDADSASITATDFDRTGIHVHYHRVTANHIEEGDSLEFDHLQAWSVNNVSHSLFHDVVFTVGGNFSNYSYPNTSTNHLEHVNVTGNSFSLGGISSDVFDTLILNNPGMIVTIGGSLNIQNYFQINSEPGFPTSISGPAVINYNDTICSDFIYLKNITANGGVFYAGDHGTDLGGNSGWTFASCSPQISNVWPGDANADLVVDNLDLLYIGVAYNDTGYVRPGASVSFTAQPCQDWYFQFINGTNIKHADSDGNGIIESTDTNAIGINYGMTHPLRLAQPDNHSYSFGPELFLDYANAVHPSSSVINIPIIFGSANNIADNIYGLAFTLNYNPALIQPGSLSVNFSGSWIENTTSHLNLVKDFPASGKCDIAFTRTSHTDESGYGQIGMLSFIVTDTSQFVPVTFSDVLAISHNEVEVPLQIVNDSVFSSIDELQKNPISIYPNPSHGVVHFNFDNRKGAEYNISILDATGKEILKSLTRNNYFNFYGNNLAKGIYYLSMQNDKSVFHGKFIIN